jgi:hypothetical protein
MPLSMTATLTPEPVPPPHAHDGVIGAGNGRGWIEGSRSVSNCSDHDGFIPITGIGLEIG